MPLDDIDPEILQFVDRYVDQFVTWDVLVFFHENQDIERKPTGIAMDIGRKLPLVEPCLASLLDRGILAREPDEAGEPTYRYVPPPGFNDDMDAFLRATRDRTTRMAIVSRVLQKEARRL